MSPWQWTQRRVRTVVDRQGVEREMDEEMRLHLEMEVEDRVRAGMSEAEARRTALRDFGPVERFQDEARDVRGIGWMENLGQDVRFALRTLRRNPGFAAVAVLTLALGIGASTAIFSVVDGVLLRALPYAEPEGLVQLWQVNAEGNQAQFSHPNFRDVRERARSLEGMAAYSGGMGTVLVGREPLRTGVADVSEDFFGVFRVRPVVGRLPSAEEHAAQARVAVVSEPFWRQRLGAARELSGVTIRIGQEVHEVVGVAPAGFGFPDATDAWAPLGPRLDEYRTGHNFRAVGRLRPGTTPEQATRELDAIARELKRQYGDDTSMEGAAAVSLLDQLVGPVRPMLLILLGASALLLLIACANVVNLLLTRMAVRRRELAVRLALGAGRGRLARQFVAESLVLTVAGGVLGTLLALLGVRLLLALEPGRLPRVEEIGVDATALAFALAVSIVAAVGMGLVVAMRASDADIRETLAEGSRGQAGGAASQRVRDVLAAGQVAMTLVLLIGAVLLGRSFLRLLAVDPGYRTEGAVVMDVLFPWTQDEAERARFVHLHETMVERLRRVPGVAAVGSVDVLPLSGASGGDGTFLIMDGLGEITDFEELQALQDDPERVGDAEYRIAGGDYFRAMEIPLLRGRLFDERDAPTAPPVAVISQALAETRWPGRDPIGSRIQFGNMDGDLRVFTVVGVVGDVRERGLDEAPRPIFYGNARQRPASLLGPMNLVLQGGDPAAVAAAARGVARELDPEMPVRTRTFEEVFSASVAQRRFSLVLLGAFAALALVLAVTGLYGIISYLVAQRTREIGIRLALGARAADVLSLVVRRGVVLALAGVALGLAAAFASTRLLSGLLFGVGATDAATFLAVPLLLTAVAALASYVPARRTTRVDPMIAMRAE